MDEIPALLHKDERIVPKAEVSAMLLPPTWRDGIAGDFGD